MDEYVGKLLENRYEILELIGVGGMAMVYKAYCHRLHRFVAVKILRKDLASDAEFRRRFHDEAQAVAMLSHPNIVSVYDVSHDQSLEYIVMELIDGITLKQYTKKKGGKLSWREALHYMTQIMRALSHAHSRGIIHRDIKPQNIMVLRDGSVRVADFGIARVMSATQNTLTQEALGSVHYISPEQAKGSHLDERADLYSAGVVLYEMLTGRLPFEGDSPVSVAIQHISSIPLSPRELNPDIPEALEDITLKAMEANVERRYKNADDMIRDLEEFRKNPNINFGYEHQGMLQSDEPTQVLDTSSLTGTLNKRKLPLRVPESEAEEQYDYDVYDNYHSGSQRRVMERRSTRRRRPLVPILAVMLVFLLGVGIFLWLFVFSDMFKQSPVFSVPNLVGRTLEEVLADETLSEHFTVIEGSQEASADYEKGKIMAQTPSENSETKEERTEIVVVVSTGKPTVMMINVNNTSYIEAKLALEALGLEVKPPDYRPHDEITREYVISSLPTEGTPMAPGDPVQLLVSSGPEQKVSVVPYLVGIYTKAEAEKLLRDNHNLKCVVSGEVYHNTIEAGKVASQSIPENTTVDAGTTISIQISKGPEKPPPEPEPKSKNILVTLPEDVEMVTVQVTVNGVEQYNQIVNTVDGTQSVVLTGNGKQQVAVFFDGKQAELYELDFDA